MTREISACDSEVRLRPGRMKTTSIQGPAADRQEILPLSTRLHHESQAHLDRLRSQVVSGTTLAKVDLVGGHGFCTWRHHGAETNRSHSTKMANDTV